MCLKIPSRRSPEYNLAVKRARTHPGANVPSDHVLFVIKIALSSRKKVSQTTTDSTRENEESDDKNGNKQ
ncbi:hypothetical protein J437_LFUL007987 [Ladona fulva]|uniref:Uncharacterized protein n=1 Tax=Ladona fulva TaxID=123851 RepID=A0A8K0NX41_LADFU|nr:hypothetical protein J437_LFUL007987 [Ladona fulva]